MDGYTVEDLRDAALALDAEGLKKEAADLLDKAELLEAQQAAAAAADRPSMVEDVARAAPAAISRGATGTLDMMQRFGESLNAGLPLNIAAAIFGERLPTAQKVDLEPLKLPMQETLADVTGGASEYRAQTIPGEYAQTIGEFVGGAAAMPIGGPLRAVGSAILPGIASETAGQLTKGTDLEGPARMAAALATPFAQAAVTPGLRRMAIGDPSEVKSSIEGSTLPRSVERLKAAGVKDIPAGRQIGSDHLMALEGSGEVSVPLRTQLTRAVLREAGADANLASDDVLMETRKRIGSVFDKADEMVDGPPLASEGQRAIAALREAEDSLSIGAVPKKLVKIVEDFSDAAVKGIDLDPRDIKATREKLNNAMNTYLRSNDMINYDLAYELLETLDDMVARQINNLSPDFMSDLSTARKQYRAYLTAERALERQGRDAAGGFITPAALSGALKNREGKSYLRGTGSDLAELGRASQEVLSPVSAVKPFGERNVFGTVMSPIAGAVATRAQDTLTMPARQAISERLLQRLARQAGPQAAMEQEYGAAADALSRMRGVLGLN